VSDLPPDVKPPRPPKKRKPGGQIGGVVNTPAMASARAGKVRVMLERMQKFAIAYADPTSKTAGSPAKSYLLIEPELSLRSAKRQAEKYLAHPKCIEMVEWVRAEAKTAAGLSGARYIHECLAVEEKLLQYALSGARGAALMAQAASKYRQLAGKAAGLLVERTEDMTPPERRALGTAEALKILEEQYARVLRLQAPNPVAGGVSAALPAGVRTGDAETVEYEIVESSTSEGTHGGENAGVSGDAEQLHPTEGRRGELRDRDDEVPRPE
jgi:hypothetical protein